MLAHVLYEIRRNEQMSKSRNPKKNININKLFTTFKKPSIKA
jgi:hypothetical protein